MGYTNHFFVHFATWHHPTYHLKVINQRILLCKHQRKYIIYSYISKNIHQKKNSLLFIAIDLQKFLLLTIDR